MSRTSAAPSGAEGAVKAPAKGAAGKPGTAVGTQQFTTFRLDGDLFGVEVESVQEVLRSQPMTRVPLAPDAVGGLLNLRGQVITAIDLRRRLGMRERAQGQLPMNVVVRTEDGAVSLLVDEIGEVVNTSSGSFEVPPDTVSARARTLIRGAYKLDDQLLLALDVPRAVDL